MDKKSCILYFSYAEQFDLLNNEDLGMLMRAFMLYATTGKETPLTGAVGMAFSFMKSNLDRDNEKWDEIRNKRSAAGKKGAESRARAKLAAEEKAKGKQPVKAGEPIFTPVAVEAEAVRQSNPVYHPQHPSTGYGSYGNDNRNSTYNGQVEGSSVGSSGGMNMGEGRIYMQEFWDSYPKQQNYEGVKQWFAENPLNYNEFKSIMAGLENHKASGQWAKEGGRYIPMPVNWLQKGKWNERLPEEKRANTEYSYKAEQEDIYKTFCEDPNNFILPDIL